MVRQHTVHKNVKDAANSQIVQQAESSNVLFQYYLSPKFSTAHLSRTEPPASTLKYDRFINDMIVDTTKMQPIYSVEPTEGCNRIVATTSIQPTA